MTNWINIEDQLPEKYFDVYCFAILDDVRLYKFMGHLNRDGYWCYKAGPYEHRTFNDTVKVTHWCEFPEDLPPHPDLQKWYTEKEEEK